MNRLKKLAGIITEDQGQGMMNKVNKISDPQVKKMFSDIAVSISEIVGFVMDMEETVDAVGLKKPSELSNFHQDATYAHGAIDDLVKQLEEYVTTLQRR
jgi:hypothetical protein